MSEGPQVRLRTEWLSRHLVGRKVLSAVSAKPAYADVAAGVQGRAVKRSYCHGKHIFIDFSGDVTLHNHLLMRGKWRREPGQLLFPSPDTWLALYVGPHTVCNISGQKLELLNGEQAKGVIQSLGPDVMTTPFPTDAVRESLRATPLPVAEAILDQRVMSGVGNVARSEILFRAGISPFLPARHLSRGQFDILCDAIEQVLLQSYGTGGRWVHRVYHQAGKPCPECGRKVQRVRIPPGRRLTYFCPVCQHVAGRQA